jgi:hypothetical protein
MNKYFIYVILFSIVYITGCSDKFPTEDLTKDTSSGNISGDTIYVKTGEWTGFNKPQDILIGREPFIYVADTDNDRIVMLNLAGQVMGTRSVKHPVAIAQDYKLNLIVCARYDTTINGVTTTYGAVYKYNMVAASHHIETAPVTMLLPRTADLNQPDRVYTGVTVFYNNTFFVARTGSKNSSIYDPDNSILYFAPKSLFNKGDGDTLLGRVPNIDPVSTGLVSANQISSITAFNKRSVDFVLTLTGQNSFRTQWLKYVVTSVDERYQSQFTSSDGVDFIKPGRFTRPEDTAIDDAGNIFIADAGTDSIYKFNSFGDEMESFGGPGVFSSPYAVAVFDGVVYVADTNNDRILKFILSTEL